MALCTLACSGLSAEKAKPSPPEKQQPRAAQSKEPSTNPISNAPPSSGAVAETNKPAAQNQPIEGNKEYQEWIHNLFNDLKVTDILLTLFTGALAIYTYRLWRSTDKLWIAGEKQLAIAKDAADAAKISADALKATERGVLIERFASDSLINPAFWAGTYPNSPTKEPSEVTLMAAFSLKNYGKTPVTIFNVHGDIFIADEPPEIRSATWLIDRALGEYTIAPQAQTHEIRITKKQEISWALSNQLVSKRVHIWLVGTIRFVDIFDETCLREFVWKYDRQTNRFKLHRADKKRSHQRPARLYGLLYDGGRARPSIEGGVTLADPQRNRTMRNMIQTQG